MASSNIHIEAACASLVREYLSRKGFKETLKKMDEECPRNGLSISNRQELMKHVHIEKLMKKNKEEPEPLKAMLEIMTKFCMDRSQQRTFNRPCIEDSDFLDGFNTNVSFSPQTNQPANNNLMRLTGKPDNAAIAAKRDKVSDDLILDDNVDGETIIGGGKSGLMTLETTEPLPQYATKSQHSRPVSAKQSGGMIISNDDSLTRRRRSQPNKLSRLSAFQQEQQKKDITSQESNNHLLLNGKDLEIGRPSKVLTSSGPEFIFHSLEPKIQNTTRKTTEDLPISFEALLLKGEERANFLSRIGLEKKEHLPEYESYKVENSSMVGDRTKPKQKNKIRDFGVGNSEKILDLEVGDLEDIEGSLGDVKVAPVVSTPQKPVKLTKLESTPIDLKTAIALKNIILGSPCQLFSDEWLLQSFFFCDITNLKYGLIQKKGGPCGVLAAVQACLLQELLFGKNKLPDNQYKNLSRIERSRFLALALSNILWRAGENLRAVVTLPCDSTHILSSTKFKQDGVTEKLLLYTFTDYEELSSFLQQSVAQFEPDNNPGVILLMYSAILSRKPHLVRADSDTPDQSTLIGSHGYCTQELINLLLTGRAVSNVFNDTMQLDAGGLGDCMILKGISGRSEIGLLSLFEHYKSCQVGTYYKTPKNPIWVVCSESHFSILFSSRRELLNDWKAERRFDLYYYDGLARQQEEIKLTISTVNQTYQPPSSDETLVPPLDHCIRTKWPDAEIDWNGQEPIL